MKTTDPLTNLRIASPCPISWEQMTGDDRVRFCDQCNLHVYDIAELTRSEATELIAGTEGRLCARLYRRNDGSVITKDCPVGLRAIRRRTARIASAVFATVVTATSVVFGQKQDSKCRQQVTISRKIADKDIDVGVFAGTILDPNGAVIVGATITIGERKSKKLFATTSNDEGLFRIALDPGVYDFEVASPGFTKLNVPQVTLGSKEKVTLEMTLMVDSTTATVGILMAEPMMDTTPSPKIVISGDLIRKLPIP